jgi:hypothetical protein
MLRGRAAVGSRHLVLAVNLVERIAARVIGRNIAAARRVHYKVGNHVAAHIIAKARSNLGASQNP